MRKLILTAAMALVLGGGAAQAAGGAPTPPDLDWSFEGPLGHFDRQQLRRGFQVYREVCQACHSLRLMYYRNLGYLGFSDDEIKEIAAEKQVFAGPDDEGSIFDEDGMLRMRPAKPSDHFVPPFRNEEEARMMNGGAMPPDLSLIVKARKNGADYVYALLNGYKDEVPEDAPEGFTLPAGKYYNEYFPGHAIGMPQPLYEDFVTYEDGTPATLDQMSRDLVTFLAWTASPELEARKRMGIKTILFLLVLTGMLYAVKRRIWADVH